MDVSYNKAQSNVSTPKSVSALMEEMAKKSHSRYAQAFEELIKKYENMDIESDILDIKKLDIVEDHGMLKNSQKRKFGYSVSYVQRTENEQQRLDDLIEGIVKPKFGLKQPTSTMTALDSREVNEKTVINKSQICSNGMFHIPNNKDPAIYRQSKSSVTESAKRNHNNLHRQELNHSKKMNSVNESGISLHKRKRIRNKLRPNLQLKNSSFLHKHDITLSAKGNSLLALCKPLSIACVKLNANNHAFKTNSCPIAASIKNKCEIQNVSRNSGRNVSNKLEYHCDTGSASLCIDGKKHNSRKNSSKSTVNIKNKHENDINISKNISNELKQQYDIDFINLCKEEMKTSSRTVLCKPDSKSPAHRTCFDSEKENEQMIKKQLFQMDGDKIICAKKYFLKASADKRHLRTNYKHFHAQKNLSICKPSHKQYSFSKSAIDGRKSTSSATILNLVSPSYLNNSASKSICCLSSEFEQRGNVEKSSEASGIFPASDSGIGQSVEECVKSKTLSELNETINCNDSSKQILNSAKKANSKNIVNHQLYKHVDCKNKMKLSSLVVQESIDSLSKSKFEQHSTTQPLSVQNMIPNSVSYSEPTHQTKANHNPVPSSFLQLRSNTRTLEEHNRHFGVHNNECKMSRKPSTNHKSMSSSLVQLRLKAAALEESNSHFNVNDNGYKNSCELSTLSCSSSNAKQVIGVENIKNDSKRKCDFKLDSIFLCLEPCKPTKSKQCPTLYKPPSISSIQSTNKRENQKGKNVKLPVLDVVHQTKAIDKSMSSSLIQTRSNAPMLEGNNRHFSVNSTGCKDSCEPSIVSCSSSKITKMAGVRNVNNDSKRKYDFELDSLLLCLEPCKPTKSKQCSTLHKPPSTSSIESTNERENPEGKNVKTYTSSDTGLVSIDKNPLQTKTDQKNLKINKSFYTQANGDFHKLNTHKKYGSSSSPLVDGNANKLPVLDVAPQTKAIHKSMSSSLVQTRSNSRTLKENNRHFNVNNTGCKSSFERNTVSCSSSNVKKMVGVENVNDSKRECDFELDSLLLCLEPCKPTKSKQCSILQKPPTISSIESANKREKPKGKNVKIYTNSIDDLVSIDKNTPEMKITQKRNLKINKSDTEASGNFHILYAHKKYASSNSLSDGNANKLPVLGVAHQSKAIHKSMSSSLVQTRSNSQTLEENNRHFSVNNTQRRSPLECNTVSCSSSNVKKMVGVENVNDSKRECDFELDSLLLCLEPCKPTKSKQCSILQKPPTISSIESANKKEKPKGKNVKIYTNSIDDLVSLDKNTPEMKITQKRNLKINKSDTEASGNFHILNAHKKYASSNSLSDGNANKLPVLGVAHQSKAIHKSMSSSLVQTRSNSQTLEENNRHFSVNNTQCRSPLEHNTVFRSSSNVKDMVGVENVNDSNRKYDFELDSLLLCLESCKPTKSKQCSTLHKSSIESASKRENPKGKSEKIYTSNDDGLVCINKNPQTKIAEKNPEIDISCVDIHASGNFCNLNTPKQCASSNSSSGGNANKYVLDVAPSLYANFKLPIPESVVLNSPGSFCLGDTVKRTDVSSIPPKKQKTNFDFKSNTCTEQPKNRKKKTNLSVSKSTKRKSRLARDLSKKVQSNQSNQSNKLINIFGTKSSPRRLKQNSISVSEPLTSDNRGFTNTYPPEDKTKQKGKTKNETSECNTFFAEPNSVVDTTFISRLSSLSFVEYSKSSFLTL